MHHVCGNGVNARFRKNVGYSFSRNIRFAAANIGSAIENAAREVGSLDGVEIDHYDIGEAEQRKVLENFIAQRACAYHQHMRGAQLLLVPPADETKATEAVIILHRMRRAAGRRCHGLAHRAPAVISGCKRRMSPSFTAASARVCESCTWRPEFL